MEGGERLGGIRPEEAHEVAPGRPGDHRVEDVAPAIGTVDVAVVQGAAVQQAEPVEQEVRVRAGAVEMPVPCGPFLIAMGGADGAVHVPHDMLETFAVVEPVEPLAVQVGQRGPVLRRGQRPGLEPPHLRGRGRLHVDSAAPRSDASPDRGPIGQRR